MNTTAICPISIHKIDENVARLNAFFTVLILTLFAFTGNIIPVLFLMTDFLLRALEFSKFSLLAILSKFILSAFKIKKSPTNAGPKIFAARIGFVFSVSILLFYLLQIQSVAIILSGIFAFCAFLESFFGFCVACQIYPFVYKFSYKTVV